MRRAGDKTFELAACAWNPTWRWRKLERRYRAAKERHTRRWWQILRLLDTGQTAAAVAGSTGYSQQADCAGARPRRLTLQRQAAGSRPSQLALPACLFARAAAGRASMAARQCSECWPIATSPPLMNLEDAQAERYVALLAREISSAPPCCSTGGRSGSRNAKDRGEICLTSWIGLCLDVTGRCRQSRDWCDSAR